jgi:hypothetical protein
MSVAVGDTSHGNTNSGQLFQFELLSSTNRKLSIIKERLLN